LSTAQQAVQAGGVMPMQNMPMMANMPEANRDYMEVMRKMNPPMMMGMTDRRSGAGIPLLDDPAPSRRHRYGSSCPQAHQDADVKRAAEKSIKEQEKEIAELTDLVKKHAK
jgi:hypothetical protein